MSLIPDTVRRQLRANLAASSMVPPNMLDEIVDLAIHAAEQGFATMQRIALETSPDPRVGLTAFGPAMGLLSMIVEGGISSLKTIASKQGTKLGEFKIGGAA